MPKSIEVAGIFFASKKALIEHCKAILYRGELNTEIVGQDERFIDAVFRGRLDKVAKLNGRRIVRYIRNKHKYKTRCFYAELDDGRLLDFSYMKFVNAYPRSTLPA